MSVVTYDVTTPASSARSGQGFFQRFFNALYEARLKKARREINRHIHLVPADVLREAGSDASLKSSLPFGR